MKTYLDMDEILKHRRRYIGQEYDEPYLVSAVPEEVIRSLPPADVSEVRHGEWILNDDETIATCSECECCIPMQWEDDDITWTYCPNCGAKMDGKTNE